ncbi:unnamed protein product [Acidocella sp. C78]|nr:unnamed protein product [Acidocella sp. C78]
MRRDRGMAWRQVGNKENQPDFKGQRHDEREREREAIFWQGIHAITDAAKSVHENSWSGWEKIRPDDAIWQDRLRVVR